MKSNHSHAKKAALAIILTLSLALIPLSVVSIAGEVTPTCVVGKSTEIYTGYAMEVPPESGGLTVETEKPITNPDFGTSVVASDNPYGSSGGVICGAFHSYADNGDTMGEMYSDSPAEAFFTGGFGKNCGAALDGKTFEEILAMSVNEIMDAVEKYDAEHPTEDPLRTAGVDFDYNPYAYMINSPLELALNMIQTNNPDMPKPLNDAVDAAKEDVTVTGVLSNPVGKAALMTTFSAASGIPVGQVADAPLGKIVVDTADNLVPKADGSKYSDSLEVLLYQWNTVSEIAVTRDTKVSDFLKDFISSDGEFVADEHNYLKYPSVFLVTGVADPDAKLNFDLFCSDSVISDGDLLIEFDGKMLDSTKIELIPNEENMTVSMSGVLSEPGYHSLHMALYGSPMYVHIELRAPDVPVSGVALDVTEKTLEIGATQKLNATITPREATNNNVTWSSDNPDVATVDANGVVTAVAVGTATITVTTKDGEKTASCVITVNEPADADEPCCLKRICTWLRILFNCIVDLLFNLFSAIGC